MSPDVSTGVSTDVSTGPVTVIPVTGLPEISAGADLAALIAAAVPELRDGDILVVTSKIVSKAEGRVVTAPRDQAIEAETVRVVARMRRRGTQRPMPTTTPSAITGSSRWASPSAKCRSCGSSRQTPAHAIHSLRRKRMPISSSPDLPTLLAR